MNKHSTGPWTAHYVGANGYIVQGGSPVQQLGVMFPKQDFVSTEQGKANARLVAAAPDMRHTLDVIASALEVLGDYANLVKLARDAIAKADGAKS